MSSAMLIAEAAAPGAARRSSAEGYLRAAPGYVAALFAGPKAALRPLYVKSWWHLALQLGKDVKISPTKTMVPLYRKHVFAQLQARAPASRLDLGLALGGLKAKGAADRHRRLRQKRPHHPSHRHCLGGGYRCGDARVACAGPGVLMPERTLTWWSCGAAACATEHARTS